MKQTLLIRLALALAALGFSGCSDRSAVAPEQYALALDLAASNGVAASNGAALLTISVTDPIGDHTGAIDVTRMLMDFDPATGDYEIVLKADPANQFDADFRVNINLFNVDDPSFFSDAVNDFLLGTPTTGLILSGVSFALNGWEAGDQVFTNSLGGTPNPPGSSLFRSAVGNLPFTFLTNEDFIAFEDRTQPATVQILTAEIRVQRLVDDVQDLVDAGTMTQDQADGLLDTLNAILEKIADGRFRPAAKQLQAFINQVMGFVNAGVLTATDRQQLIDAAQAAMDQLMGSVVVTPALATLGSLGETVQLAATALDASGTTISDKTFTWMSSDNGIATVSTSGLVTAVANGSVTITATADAIDGAATVVVTTSFAYVTNRSSNTVSVIKIASNTVVGDFPGEVAITPDGAFAYVPIIPTQPGAVSVIETASNTVVGTVGVGFTPISVAITPDGSFAYVANVGSRTVSVIETVSNTVVATIQVSNSPFLPRGVAITPDGSFAYVNFGDGCPGKVSVIEIMSNTVVATIDVDACTGGGVAITPDGAFAYVPGGSSVSVIETASNTVVGTISVPGFTNGEVAITPDGAFAYVPGSFRNTGGVFVIETASNTVVSAISVPGTPRGVAITPEGAFVYVTLFDNDALAVISTITNTVVATIDVGGGPFGVAVTPF